MNSKESKTRKTTYKKYKENHSRGSKGLGDTVEKITKKTGIKKVVDTVFQKLEKSCGCEERKERLNEIFRYEKPECFTEEDFNVVHEAVTTNKLNFTGEEQEQWKDIYMRVFPNSKRPDCTRCSFRSVIYDKLKQVYNQYK